MFTPRNYEYNFICSLRWVARSLTVFCIGTLILFLFSLGLDLLLVAWEDMVVMLIFLLGFFSGSILAWLDEAKGGGALALLSVAAFYLVYGSALERSISQLIWICIFASPGLLFLLYGEVSSRNESRTPVRVEGQQRA